MCWQANRKIKAVELNGIMRNMGDPMTRTEVFDNIYQYTEMCKVVKAPKTK
jgi:hypothetical protein